MPKKNPQKKPKKVETESESEASLDQPTDSDEEKQRKSLYDSEEEEPDLQSAYDDWYEDFHRRIIATAEVFFESTPRYGNYASTIEWLCHSMMDWERQNPMPIV
jgi:hypothetical protein